ncbi:MAG: flagellar assembly protein H [Microcystis sp. LE17-20D]|nr:flagellar assembly protein H [Microcystis sp. LE17-20D]MCZ8065145.1 flagellar assembly protein H [Microcystis sp. LE17-20D]MCZ8162974.1 flagellar assembly protein H [Microcystis sp. LE19-196.1B]
MTRFIHDQFAKDYLEELLSSLGEVKSARVVRGEVREIDVWFSPNILDNNPRELLGLLGKMAINPCLFEPFRNPVTATEIRTCLLKLLQVEGEINRRANRQKTNVNDGEIPRLWILTPTASAQLLGGFGAKLDEENWGEGIYFLAPSLRTAITVIHQLPPTEATLWLRILGRGKVQARAIDELESLPENHPFRVNALELLLNLRTSLTNDQELEQEDRELIMRLSPLYTSRLQEELDAGRQQGLQQGLQQGERLVVENLLKARFGSLDPDLSVIIDRILLLPVEEFTPLILNSSRTELIAHFSN